MQYRWSDEAETRVIAFDESGKASFIPKSSPRFSAIPVGQIQPFEPLPPSPGDVRIVAAKLKRDLIGVNSDEDFKRLEDSGTREAVRLNRIGEENWTVEQAQRAAELEAFEAMIYAIDAAAEAIIATEGGIPTTYATDSRWPNVSG